MKLFKKALVGVAVAAAFASAAQANVIAMADLTISSLSLFNATGSVFTNLTVLNETRTSSSSSNFNGVASPSGSASSTTIGATVDSLYKCTGPSCGSISAAYGGNLENNFTSHITTAIGNYALGDSFISGSAFGGSASGLTRADASLTGTGNGGGAGSLLNTLGASATFLANSNASVFVGVGYNVFLETVVSSLLPGQSGIASAGTKWNMKITDESVGGPFGVLVLDIAPGEMNGTFTSDGGIQANKTFENKVGSFASSTFNVIGGHVYSVLIQQSSLSVVSQVPEPASLALVGLGLLGLAASRRRKSV